MPRLHIPNFLGGINTDAHSTQLEVNEAQVLENMWVDDKLFLGSQSYQTILSCRPAYTRFNAVQIADINRPRVLLEDIGGSVGSAYYVGGLYVDGGGTSSSIVKVASGATTTKNFSATTTPSRGPRIIRSDLTDIFYFMLDGSVGYKLDAARAVSNVTVVRGDTAVIYKNRLWYDDKVAGFNILKFSDVGAYETVGASSFLTIGNFDEMLTGLIPTSDKLIILKEHSIWYLYPAANILDSTIVQVDFTRGCEWPGEFLVTPYGIFIYSPLYGLQLYNNNLESINLKINNSIKTVIRSYLLGDVDSNYGETRNRLAIYGDYLFIYNQLGTSGTLDNSVVYCYHLLSKRVFTFKFSETLGMLHSAQKPDGIIGAFSNYLTAIFDGYICQFSNQGTPVETTISCKYRTGDLSCNPNDFGKQKKLNYIILTFIAPDNITPLTIKSYGDTVLKETLTLTPSTGYNSIRIDFTPTLSRGKFLGFQCEYSQPTSVTNNKFSLIDAIIDYTVEDVLL